MGYCVRCERVVDVLVIGGWAPLWALCPDCAAEVLRESEASDG
jgi:hypothetical protein